MSNAEVRLSGQKIDPDQPALILYTSGTIANTIGRTSWTPVTLGNAAGVHAWSGNAARAAELRSKLEFLAQIRYVPNTALAFAYNVPGDEDSYYKFMDRAVAERDPIARTLRVMCRFLPVASDPRFDVLLQKVGLNDQDVAQAAAIDLAG